VSERRHRPEQLTERKKKGRREGGKRNRARRSTSVDEEGWDHQSRGNDNKSLGPQATRAGRISKEEKKRVKMEKGWGRLIRPQLRARKNLAPRRSENDSLNERERRTGKGERAL